MGMTATTNSYAAGLGAYGGPSVPSTTTQSGTTTTAETNALHEWPDDVIKNDKMRQRMSLPSAGESQTTAQATTQEGSLRQLQDETIKNNAMRNRMGLSQQ
jgi:hypothetical protein